MTTVRVRFGRNAQRTIQAAYRAGIRIDVSSPYRSDHTKLTEQEQNDIT